MWRKERKRQPTNGQKNCKIIVLPMGNSQILEIKCKQINDVTNVRVTRIKDYDIPMMVRVGEHRKREIKEADKN
jgi:hypothetical protein